MLHLSLSQVKVGQFKCTPQSLFLCNYIVYSAYLLLNTVYSLRPVIFTAVQGGTQLF